MPGILLGVGIWGAIQEHYWKDLRVPLIWEAGGTQGTILGFILD